ncbi:hypothetical protein FRB95_014654 [Tulasnella sp. JGI-2019a]|nr:hypothetical protein FRB95_014654 [Tulasnella sp. JGI-2019a]
MKSNDKPAGASIAGINTESQRSTSASLQSRTLSEAEATLEGKSTHGAVDDKSLPSSGDEKALAQYSATDCEQAATVLALEQQEDAELHIVTGAKFWLIFTGMMLSIFLVTLDQTILATAIPRIASDFDALEQQTWIASAYLLTQSGFILTYGQLLAVVNTKWIYLTAVAIFEIGSIICGAAQSMDVLIFGRAFAGAGAAGIFVTTLCILARITRIEQRALLFGLFGAVFALSSVVGPLLGGAFTDHVSWRWVFFINIPFGVITILTILLFIKREHSAPPADITVPEWKRIMNIDWIGYVLSVCIITALLLPLQWGGVTKSWSDKAVVASFCVLGGLIVVFLAWEWHKGDKAVMPLSIWKNRTQVGCCASAFFSMLILCLAIYYLPLYYQSSQGKSATSSGIAIVPFMVFVVVGTIGAGGIINKFGRPLPFLILSPLLSAIGSGLVYWNMKIGTSSANLYGFQILLSLGVGGAIQNTIILTGGTIGISIAGTIFGNQLTSAMTKYAPDLSASTIIAVRQSVDVISMLQGEDRVGVIKAYSESLVN